MNDFPHQLYNTWINMHEALQEGDDVKWGTLYDNFDALLSKLGKEGKLNEGIGETMRMYGERMQQYFVDDNGEDKMNDLLALFHHDVVSNLSVSFSQNTDHNKQDDNATARRVELFALPLFGEHESLVGLCQQEGFVDVVRESGVLPEGCDIRLFGACASEQAGYLMMKPQIIYETINLAKEIFEDCLGRGNDLTSQIRTKWSLLTQGEDTGDKLTVGGYVLLGAYSITGDIAEVIPQDISDEEDDEAFFDKWDEMVMQWAQGQPNAKKLALGSIHAPSTLLDGTALSIAEFLISSLNIQSSMGQTDEEPLHRLEIVIPDEELDEDDIAHVYGYGQDGTLLWGVQTHALVFGLLFNDIVEQWEAWMPHCQIGVVQVPLDQYLGKKNKHTLH